MDTKQISFLDKLYTSVTEELGFISENHAKYIKGSSQLDTINPIELKTLDLSYDFFKEHAAQYGMTEQVVSEYLRNNGYIKLNIIDIATEQLSSYGFANKTAIKEIVNSVLRMSDQEITYLIKYGADDNPIIKNLVDSARIDAVAPRDAEESGATFDVRERLY
ncbi:MAG: hypothetical protein K0B02_01760 [DPANN group archaeon]|nr:hypothetical protein [DPANN group archaeon]